MDNSRKRSRDHSAGIGPSKRARRLSCSNYILTSEQQAVIDLASNTFQISSQGLLDAINDLKNSARHSPPDILRQKPVFSPRTMTINASGSLEHPLPTIPPKKHLPKYSMAQVTMRNRSHVPSSSFAPEVADTTFGFHLKDHSSWSSCFANMIPFEQETPSISDTAAQYPLDEKRFGSYRDSNQDDSHTLDSGSNWCYPDYYACDEFTSQCLPSSAYPAYTPLQTTQPSLSRQEMVFQPNSIALAASKREELDAWSPRQNDERPISLPEHWPSLSSTDSGMSEEQKPKSPDTIQKGSRLRRGKFKNLEDREQTAQTRVLTACLRCRIQRIRCVPNPDDLHGVCKTCMNVTRMKVSKLPCLRYKVTDVRLFVTSMAPGRIWSTRWQDTRLRDIDQWASSDIRTILMTQDYSPRPIAIKVRRFVPLVSDMLQRSWAHGVVKKSVTLPPYAFANMKGALESYMIYINQEGSEHFNRIVDREDQLLRVTYSAAIKASNVAMTEPERELLKMVLQLWVASRMTTKSIRLCGNDTLDIPHNLLDESHPMHGQIPITPVMGAQFDTIVTHGIMIPLRNKILDKLSALILANKPSNWFCVYLCIFVLLHDCSLKVAKNAIYARKHGMKTQFANMDNISEIRLGANILLAHFHYSCKGDRVFEEEWRMEETRSMADLTEEQTQFIQKTAAHIKANKTQFAAILDKNLVEHPHFFIAQLYEEDWKPRSTNS